MSDEVLQQRLTMLHEDVNDMKAAIKELTNAVHKLALVEQAQGQMALAIERAFSSITENSKRLSEIEKRLPEVTRTSVWVDRGVWSAAAVAVTMLLKKSGLL